MAAILFLLPRTLVVGAWFLLTVFAGATFLHIAHGQFEVGGLLVYGASVLVVLAFHEIAKYEVRREGCVEDNFHDR